MKDASFRQLPDEVRQYLIAKSFEIGYAIVRASSQPKDTLVSRLEENSMRLIEEAVRNDLVGMRVTLEVAEQLIRLGTEMGRIRASFAEVINQEIAEFKYYIYDLEKEEVPEEHIADIFSAKAPRSNQEVDKRLDKNENWKEQIIIPSEPQAEVPSELVERDFQGSDRIINRQSAIAERIRQLGNCHLKGLLEFFHGISERTLRYDLQKLVEQGIIERIGNGGPGTFYRIKTFEMSEGYPQNPA